MTLVTKCHDPLSIWLNIGSDIFQDNLEPAALCHLHSYQDKGINLKPKTRPTTPMQFCIDVVVAAAGQRRQMQEALAETPTPKYKIKTNSDGKLKLTRFLNAKTRETALLYQGMSIENNTGNLATSCR